MSGFQAIDDDDTNSQLVLDVHTIKRTLKTMHKNAAINNAASVDLHNALDKLQEGYRQQELQLTRLSTAIEYIAKDKGVEINIDQKVDQSGKK